jgi:hypothetical protein
VHEIDAVLARIRAPIVGADFTVLNPPLDVVDSSAIVAVKVLKNRQVRCSGHDLASVSAGLAHAARRSRSLRCFNYQSVTNPDL